MRAAQQVVEALVGPEHEKVLEIVQIIQGSRTWQEANKKLEPYLIQFSDDHVWFRNNNAIAGFDAETGLTLLNAKLFGRAVNWVQAIEHEETHRAQMLAAYHRGGDLSKIAKSHEKYFFDREGRVRYDRYVSHPLELQALARNAITNARAKGHDPVKLMRRGTLGHHAPIQPGDPKRFGKYAHQMLRAEAMHLVRNLLD